MTIINTTTVTEQTTLNSPNSTSQSVKGKEIICEEVSAKRKELAHATADTSAMEENQNKRPQDLLTYKITFARNWNGVASPEIYWHDEGYYIVKFQNAQDRDDIMCSGPYTIKGIPLCLKKWSAAFDFQKEMPTTLPLWAEEPLYADECTKNQTRISYTRVLVDMNINQELPKEIEIVDPYGRKFIQQVTYDWKPVFCTICPQFGHVCRRGEKGPLNHEKGKEQVAQQGLNGVVYGSNNLEERKEMWKGILQIGALIDVPWCICGDFNTPLHKDDRRGGNSIVEAETRDFQKAVEDLNLVDMKATGRQFTWTNKHVWSKIDRVICNEEWVIRYGSITEQFLENNMFDHAPIHIEVAFEQKHSKKPFRFINALTDDDKFLLLIQQLWNKHVKGRGMTKLWRKMQLCKTPLNQLKTKSMSNLEDKIMQARDKLQMVQYQLGDKVDPMLIEEEKAASADLQKWLEVQENVFKQKSKAL
ncbi:hypothetical protein T459_05081 [Capsicum annuum]|uniref:Uncharacterized protein n=1 Tax=Capsicum annuum TaxID=4072 RepID=A0A2G3A6Y7_CAPAN|nr:hypothetical protein FXO37_07406 [Capsicum annuum]PHT89968.1 hypothetical protein T459_05081 [Capsicum annuum]